MWEHVLRLKHDLKTLGPQAAAKPVYREGKVGGTAPWY